MTTLPHDIPDLYLAPLILALDARIEELALLDLEQLRLHVAMVSDTADWTRELRELGLIRAVQHLIDCHHWERSWSPRGICLSHGNHQLVLGVPPTFTEFLSGTASGAGLVALP
jgi:hypothetical protein